MRRAASHVIIAALLLAGCGEAPGPSVTTGTPTPTPTSRVSFPPVATPTPIPAPTASTTPQPSPTLTPASASPTPSPTLPPGVLQQRVQGDLLVTVTDGRSTIPAALVRLFDAGGLELAQGTTNSLGQFLFPTGQAPAGGFTVRVESVGDFRRTTCPFEINRNAANDFVIPMSTFGRVSGQVTDSAGVPIYGAVVSDLLNSTVTAQDGTFFLPQVPLNTYTLRARKTRFKVATRSDLTLGTQNNACGRLILEPEPAPVRVLFDGSKAPFGVTGYTLAGSFTKLKAALEARGMVVQMGGNTSLTDFNYDTIVIVSPTTGYVAAELQGLKDFVQSGKKLVVLGEWGGFSGFANPAVGFTGTDYNLQVASDVAKEFGGLLIANNPAFIRVDNLGTHPITRNVQSVAMFRTASVQVPTKFTSTPDPHEARIVGQTTSLGLQVTAANATVGLIGASVSGVGTIVVIGDTSLWADFDAEGGITANIDKFGNKALAANVFEW